MKQVTRPLIARLCLVLCTVLFLFPGQAALAEDDPEVTMEELTEDTGIEDALETQRQASNDAAWTFPIPLPDIDPALVVLANKEQLLDQDFVPQTLVTMKKRRADNDGNNLNGGVPMASSGTMKLSEKCAAALVDMLDAGIAQGQTLYLKSAYRSYQTQHTMYYNRLKRNNGKDDGWVALPGSSDHQTGLGCDIVPRGWRNQGMNAKMAIEAETQWLAAHCHEYGFILRYPKDKTQITGINFEPWHMRYVGIPVATYIMEKGITLEEFHQELQAAVGDYLAAGGDPAAVQGLGQT